MTLALRAPPTYFDKFTPMNTAGSVYGPMCVAALQRPVDRGDVLLSLSYLPTAERLILVVVKARNLLWPTTKPVGGIAIAAAVESFLLGLLCWLRQTQSDTIM